MTWVSKDKDDNYDDYPLEEIEEAVAKHIKAGHEVFQKFTCIGCGERLMVEEANRLYTSGSCDKCGVVTDIKKTGCNYLVIIMNAKEIEKCLNENSPKS